MKLPSGNFFHLHANSCNTPDNFPIGASSDYTAIKRITVSEIEKWPRVRLQMLIDYCLSKKIFEAAAMIRMPPLPKDVNSAPYNLPFSFSRIKYKQ